MKESVKKVKPFDGEVKTFNSPVFGKIRLIYSEKVIWFVARDIVNGLKYSNVSVALSKHCLCVEKRAIPEIVKKGYVNTIPMEDVRILVDHSHARNAKELVTWLMKDVIPKVIGTYVPSNEPSKTEVTDINVVEWNGERVLTTKQLAAVYGCPENNIRNNFHNNPSRFKASRHFYRLEGSDIKAFMGNINNIDVAPSNANAIYLWTKRGALRHCKMLGTDTAWDVFDELEETYFSVRSGKIAVPNFSNPAEAARAWADEYEKRMQAELQSAQMKQIVSDMKPKADYTDKILKSTNTVTITQIAKDYGLSGQALNKLLHEYHVQYPVSGQWLLYSKYHGLGYTHSNTVDIEYNDGSSGSVMHTKWTQKGRLFIYSLLKSKGVLPLIEQENA